METESGIRIRGFSRVQIVDPDGTIAGDSDWKENTVTNSGKRYYLAAMLGKYAGSSGIAYAALGTGTAANATHTTQDGELAEGVRDALSAASSGSTAVRFTGTFASDDNFATATRNISNIGLWATDTGGSLFSGAAYASSSCATNQAVNNLRRLLATVEQALLKFGETLSETIPSQALAYS